MNIYKWLLIFSIAIIFFNRYAMGISYNENKSPSSTKEKKLLEDFFIYLSFLGVSENKIEEPSLRIFMNPDCVVQSNNTILSRGIYEFIAYINTMQEKYEKVCYSAFLEEPIINKHQAAIHFQVHCKEKNGSQQLLDVLAIATFQEGKINHWTEIFSPIPCNINKKTSLQHSYEELQFHHSLYPITPPSYEGYLPVSKMHTIFYATYGNPKGIPIVVLHGGPGEGVSNILTRFFDLTRYYVIMFDQRGSNRSTPFACMKENSPAHSIEDIETLRKHLKIEKWLVFGGSWGSTLGILYGQSYPERCKGFVLRGIFLGREEDYLHLFYGMGKLSPKAYDQFLHHVPAEERLDLLSAYYKRIMDPDPKIYMPASRSFIEFDASCVRFSPNAFSVENMLKNDQIVYCVAKHFLYYAKNKFFLEPNQIVSRMDRIKHLPAMIIHGKYDIVTLPENAYTLHQKWTNSTLWMIPQGGHTSIEPAIASALATALDFFADKITEEDL